MCDINKCDKCWRTVNTLEKQENGWKWLCPDCKRKEETE